MKKKIPGIILIIFGLLLMPNQPAPGLVFVAIGAAVLAMSGRKKKKVEQPTILSGPTEYAVSVIIKSKKDVAALRTENPAFKNPKKTGKPVYQYRFFEDECQLVPDEKTINVMYGDVLVGYVDAVQVEGVKEIMDSMIGEPMLRIYGGGVKEWDGKEWVAGKVADRAEVRLTYMR